jgi:hypothetical protein
LELGQQRCGKPNTKHTLSSCIRPERPEALAQHATYQPAKRCSVKISQIKDIDPHDFILSHPKPVRGKTSPTSVTLA